MRYYHLLFMVFLYFSSIWSQEVSIAFQGFESGGDTWEPLNYSTPPCSSGDDFWDYMKALPPILPGEGEQFWGVQDLNGDCGSLGFEWIEFPNTDISLYQGVRCSFDLQVVGYDSGDDVLYEPWFDDMAQDKVKIVDGNSNFSTQGWIRVSIEIPNNVSSFKLRIHIKQNGSDQAGIDNVSLRGIPISPCSELFISEYVEGGSSTEHRNNYIEIFNPSENEIALADYDLVKYTGKSAEASSKLNLEGHVPPLGTFLIEDDQELLNVSADLSSNSAVMNYNGDDKIGLQYKGQLIDIVGTLGDSLYFGKDLVLRRKSAIKSPDSQFNSNEWDVYPFESIGDLNKHQSVCQGPLPEIEVLGMGLVIPDGNQRSQTLDNTYFGYLEHDTDESVSHDFVIQNTGTAPLQIERIEIDGRHPGDFSLSSQGSLIIPPGDHLLINITFQPNGKGVRDAVLRILNNDPSERDYTCVIQGEGSHYSNGPIMITTYYEGDGNNRWIEITNTSQENVEDNSYFLGLYKQDILHAPLYSRPSIKKAIPFMRPGQTLKFRASLNVDKPTYAIDGSEIPSGICSFNGDDVLIVSTTDDETAWENRLDIIGRDGSWGVDLAYLRKYGCDQEYPHTGFYSSHWIPYAPSEIDNALPESNTRLGEYALGPTIFDGASWSNGIPDLNRSARILGDYSSEHDGDLRACNLFIDGNAKVVIGSGSHVLVLNDLEVYGSLDVLNGGDLLMINNSGKVFNSGEIMIHKSSQPVSPYDYTYWSSPLKSADLSEVFYESNPNHMYSYSTSFYEDEDGDGVNDNNKIWTRAEGEMLPGKGYAVLSPESIIPGKSHEVLFKGEVNNGIVELPIHLSKQKDTSNDWNLIGNPYPSAIDAERLLTHPKNSGLLGGTLYFWTHNTPLSKDSETDQYEYNSADYAMYTIGTGGIRAHSGGAIPSKFISSGQGFFVEARKEGFLYFDNSMRSVDTEQTFFKSSPMKWDKGYRIWLNLKAENGAFSQILIGFLDDATDGYEPYYDGIRFSANTELELYSLVDNMQLGIRGDGSFHSNRQIPLGYDLHSEGLGELMIEIDALSGELNKEHIILVDHYLGVQHDLKQGTYSFHSDKAGPVNDRFSLFFDPTLEITEEVSDQEPYLIWSFENDELVVRTRMNDMIYSLEIFDFLGRSVAAVRDSNISLRVSLGQLAKNAPYILFVTLADNRTLSTRILDLRP